MLRFKGAERDPREIGSELGVQVVVEGSVGRARGDVRVSVRLIGVADGFQAINDEAARAIALAVTLERDAPAREAPENPLAVDLYLRARNEYRKFWASHQQAAASLFDQALALSPDDPMILSGRAMALSRLFHFTGEGGDEARTAAERAVAMGPTLGEARLALAISHLQGRDAPGAVRELRQAIARNPGLAKAHGTLGAILVEAGAIDEGRRSLDNALALDGQLTVAFEARVRLHMLFDEWEQADALFTTPGLPFLMASQVRSVVWRRDRERAKALLQELGDGTSDVDLARRSFLELVVRGEPTPVAEDFARQLVDRGSLRTRLFRRQMRVEARAFLGDTDGAALWLVSAVERGLTDLLWVDRRAFEGRVRRRVPRWLHQRPEQRRSAHGGVDGVVQPHAQHHPPARSEGEDHPPARRPRRRGAGHRARARAEVTFGKAVYCSGA
ncbi:MAG: hypothetical protein EXR72_22970 [Myxococcales bacterium]|nr:hypothetical protein [Myxococcales bacterium]